ncbi:MAG: hypothetical protein AAFN80_06280 [Pseudomonadota bacterium]
MTDRLPPALCRGISITQNGEVAAKQGGIWLFCARIAASQRKQTPNPPNLAKRGAKAEHAACWISMLLRSE